MIGAEAVDGQNDSRQDMNSASSSIQENVSDDSPLAGLCKNLSVQKEHRGKSIRSEVSRISLFALLQRGMKYAFVPPETLELEEEPSLRQSLLLINAIPLMLSLGAPLGALLSHIYLAPSIYVLSLFTLAFISNFIVHAYNFSNSSEINKVKEVSGLKFKATVSQTFVALAMTAGLVMLSMAIAYQVMGEVLINEFALILAFSLIASVVLIGSFAIEIFRLKLLCDEKRKALPLLRQEQTDDFSLSCEERAKKAFAKERQVISQQCKGIIIELRGGSIFPNSKLCDVVFFRPLVEEMFKKMAGEQIVLDLLPQISKAEPSLVDDLRNGIIQYKAKLERYNRECAHYNRLNKQGIASEWD